MDLVENAGDQIHAYLLAVYGKEPTRQPAPPGAGAPRSTPSPCHRHPHSHSLQLGPVSRAQGEIARGGLGRERMGKGVAICEDPRPRARRD
eukprot:scaffold153337_cov31-Tisochrysis_lutea.AAC.1